MLSKDDNEGREQCRSLSNSAVLQTIANFLKFDAEMFTFALLDSSKALRRAVDLVMNVVDAVVNLMVVSTDKEKLLHAVYTRIGKRFTTMDDPHRCDIVKNLVHLSIVGSEATKRYSLAVLTSAYTKNELIRLREFGFERSTVANFGTMYAEDPQKCKPTIFVNYLVLIAESVDTNVGKDLLRSRRADYLRILSGGDLEERQLYSRLSEDKVHDILDFLVERCDLSFRKAHLVYANFGREKVAIPRLRRTESISMLVAIYTRNQQNLAGINLFRSVCSQLTSPVKDTSGVDYYYVQGVIEVFPFLSKMLSRMQMLAEGLEITREIKSMSKVLPLIHEFMKYDLREHLALESNVGFHCSYRAVNGHCFHQHNFGCQKCAALDNFFYQLDGALGELRAKANDDSSIEIESMSQCTYVLRKQTERYIKHVTRALWQKKSINAALATVASDAKLRSTKVFIVLDHKRKVLARKLVESQVEYFGKSGMSLLGSMIYSFPEAPIQEKFEAQIHFIDFVVSNGIQDAFQVISALDAMRKLIRRQFPSVIYATLISDNASVFSSAEINTAIAFMNYNSDGFYFDRYMNTEAQAGTDMLDTHFSYMNAHCFDNFVRSGNDMLNPAAIYSALTLFPLKNSTPVLLKIDENLAEIFNSRASKEKLSFKTAQRRIHDVIHVNPATVSRSSNEKAIVMEIYTNTGVPNEAVVEKRNEIHSKRERGQRVGSLPKWYDDNSNAEVVRHEKLREIYKSSAYALMQQNYDDGKLLSGACRWSINYNT